MYFEKFLRCNAHLCKIDENSEFVNFYTHFVLQPVPRPVLSTLHYTSNMKYLFNFLVNIIACVKSISSGE